jgi:hypothetical protein
MVPSLKDVEIPNDFAHQAITAGAQLLRLEFTDGKNVGGVHLNNALV